MPSTRIPTEQRQADLLAAMTDQGATVEQLMPLMGFKCKTNLVTLLCNMGSAGLVFTCRAKISTDRAISYYFASMEARDKFYAAYEAMQKERRKKLNRDRDLRRKDARNASRSTALKVKRAQDAAFKLKQAQEAKAAKDRQRQADQSEKDSDRNAKRDRMFTELSKKTKAVHIEPVITAQTKITRVAPPPDRWAVAPGLDGFSRMKPGQYAHGPVSCAARAAI